MTLTLALHRSIPINSHLQRAALEPSSTRGCIRDLPIGRATFTVCPTVKQVHEDPEAPELRLDRLGQLLTLDMQLASPAALPFLPSLARMSNAPLAYEAAVEFHPGPTVFSPHRDSAWPGADLLAVVPCSAGLDYLSKTCLLELLRSGIDSLALE